MNQGTQNPPETANQQRIRALEEAVSKLKKENLTYRQMQSKITNNIIFLKGILEQSLAGIYVIDKGKFSYVNQYFANMFGYSSPKDLINKIQIIELVAPECREMVLENVKKRTTGEINEIRYTFTGLRKDGTRNVVEVHGTSTMIEGNHSVVGIILDMTDYRRVTTLAFYDSLTRLPNRALFHDRLEQVIARSHRSQESFALLFIDLNGFKAVNDGLGHAAGDHVLQEFSQRMAGLFRESDTISRFGGDEFGAIITGTEDHKSITRQAKKINHILKSPIYYYEHAISLGASIGISLFPDNGKDIETLLHKADLAMYEAKKRGRNTYRFAK